MHRVKLLPPDVISKIAAGEVVDKPASVVKELIENAIDAGSTKIDITLKDAGKTLIAIKDNGHGIDHMDLPTIFMRHATSKIDNIDDLEHLSSLGFRGEALYSIAAVSDIEVRSQAKRSKDSWRIQMTAGVQKGYEPTAPFGHGTEIKVSELFFNVPARKKFLKSDTSEMNQILNVVVPHTMLHPNIHFTLIHNDKKVLDLPIVPQLAQRFAMALNVDAKHLIEDEHSLPDDELSLRMVLGNINLQRHRRDQQYVFVNGRPVESKNIAFHCNDMYRLIFPPQVYPIFAVFINLPADRVDANIHPTKREVKIRQEGQLFSRLRHALEQTLMTRGQPRVLEDETQESDVGNGFKPFRDGEKIPDQGPACLPAGRDDKTSAGIPSDQILFDRQQYKTQSTEHRTQNTESDFFQNKDLSLHDKLKDARHVGHFCHKYQILEFGESLFFVDQHAAQERIMFEKFRNQINEGDIEVQKFLAPEVLPLSPTEFVAWEESQSELEKCGFDTNAMDDSSIAIQSAPVLIKNSVKAVQAILAGEKHERCDHLIIATRACKASIVTGDHLTKEQALHQRDQLLQCEDPFTCPHGRPTVIEVKQSFIDRQFLRT